MSCKTSNFANRVTLLTPLFALTLSIVISGCTYINRHYIDPCKSRAYIGMDLQSYIKSRFHKDSPVRMAVIPYSVPANLSFTNTEQPGLGRELAWRIHREILPADLVPIAEVFNRQDWPGKKDEFFTGNYGTMAFAREAGYDLALIGYVEPLKSMDAMTVFTKIIEVESGITVYYGKTEVSTYRPELEGVRASLWLTEHTPSKIYVPEMIEQVGRCVVRGIKNAEE